MTICINPNCNKPHNRDTVLFCSNCNSELLLDGRYRTVRQLGKGGFGKTYEVSDCTPGNWEEKSRLKVLKVLTHTQSKYIELFKREAHVLAQLNHPGIPRVEPDDYFTYQPENLNEPIHCIVMEKVEGLNLLDYIQRRDKVVKEKRAIQWFIQLVTILREVHRKNFFHRDIKPSNIMLRSDGQLVLIDFGTVREINETFVVKKSQGQLTGIISNGYTPVEQMNGSAVPQSDFFALGRTFVYLLTAKEPNYFYNAMTDSLEWHQATSDASPLLVSFIDRMMATRIQDRPQTASEILEQITEIYHQLYPTSQSTVGQTRMDISLPPEVIPQETQKLNRQSPQNNELEKSESNLNAPIRYKAKELPVSQVLEQSFSFASTSQMPVDIEFISRCQQELLELIGPIASIICKRIIDKNSQISVKDFVEQLSQKIPNPEQALEFKKRLLK